MKATEIVSFINPGRLYTPGTLVMELRAQVDELQKRESQQRLRIDLSRYCMNFDPRGDGIVAIKRNGTDQLRVIGFYGRRWIKAIQENTQVGDETEQIY